MKKGFIVALVVCFTFFAILFGASRVDARRSRVGVKQLAQAGASDAYKNFLEYQTTNDESHYWYAVAGFRSFEQAYRMLTEGTNKSPNYVFCNEVYGNLVLFPKKSQNHILELINVMGILSSDVEDENGFILMAELRNSIQE